MFVFRHLLLRALASLILVSSSIQAPAEIIDAPTISSHTSELSYFNSTTTSFNVSRGPSIHCLGASLGYGLVPASCQDIVPNSMLNPLDDTPKTWGPRRSMLPYDFPMPQTFVSREGFHNMLSPYKCADVICRRWYMCYRYKYRFLGQPIKVKSEGFCPGSHIAHKSLRCQ